MPLPKPHPTPIEDQQDQDTAASPPARPVGPAPGRRHLAGHELCGPGSWPGSWPGRAGAGLMSDHNPFLPSPLVRGTRQGCPLLSFSCPVPIIIFVLSCAQLRPGPGGWHRGGPLAGTATGSSSSQATATPGVDRGCGSGTVEWMSMWPELPLKLVGVSRRAGCLRARHPTTLTGLESNHGIVSLMWFGKQDSKCLKIWSDIIYFRSMGNCILPPVYCCFESIRVSRPSVMLGLQSMTGKLYQL